MNPLMCLPGGPGFSANALAPATALIPSAPQTSRVDLPEAATDLDACVDHLEAQRVAAGAEQIHLFGHSFGALWAAAYAAKHPRRVASLVSVGAPGLTLEVFGYLVDNVLARLSGQTWADAAAALGALPTSTNPLEDFKAAFALVQEAYVFAKPHATSLAELVRNDFRPDAYFAITGALAQTGLDLTGAFTDAPYSTLHIRGRQDIIPAHLVAQYAGAFPTAQIVTLEQCGHYPWLDQPEGFTKAVEGFYAGVLK